MRSRLIPGRERAHRFHARAVFDCARPLRMFSRAGSIVLYFACIVNPENILTLVATFARILSWQAPLSGREHKYDDVDCGYFGIEQGGVATCVPGGTCLVRQRRTAPKEPQPFRAGCSAPLRYVAAHRRWADIASSRRLAEVAHYTPSTQPYLCSRPLRLNHRRTSGALRKRRTSPRQRNRIYVHDH